jgi:uroporphyrinogen decarboxylase
MMTDLTRFLACMEYQPTDHCPNHEIGVWPQTRSRWRQEAAAEVKNFQWNWLKAEPSLDLDVREYIPVDYGFIPPFPREILDETDAYQVVRDEKGVVTRMLKAGMEDGIRICMHQYLDFPVSCPEDFKRIKTRLIAALPRRYPADLDARILRWRQRDYPLVLGENVAANGFYWRSREFMGTENLSLAWYDYPDMMHEIMEFFADFLIETSRPVLEKIQVEYFTFNEDLSMKNGPLIGPAHFREFIFPHLRRVVDFFKSHGVKYVAVDTDGDPTVLIPLFLEAGIDVLWPLERASEVHPLALRRKFCKSLRMWGGVDKRVLTQGPRAINAHLAELIPLIEEGGFIPAVDHTVPPDVSWDNFRHYMDAKQALLHGEYHKLA